MASTSNTFVDVNREMYIKSLFLDACKQAKANVLPDEAAEIIKKFISGNPTNSDKVTSKLKVVNGKIIIPH